MPCYEEESTEDEHESIIYTPVKESPLVGDNCEKVGGAITTFKILEEKVDSDNKAPSDNTKFDEIIRETEEDLNICQEIYADSHDDFYDIDTTGSSSDDIFESSFENQDFINLINNSPIEESRYVSLLSSSSSLNFLTNIIDDMDSTFNTTSSSNLKNNNSPSSAKICKNDVEEKDNGTFPGNTSCDQSFLDWLEEYPSNIHRF